MKTRILKLTRGFWLSIIALALAAAACGGPGGGPGGGTVPDEPDGRQNGAAADAAGPGDQPSASGSGEGAQTRMPDGTEAEGGTSGEPAEAAEDETAEGRGTPAEPQYYMNKNYFIKPIDEGADNKVVLLTFDDGPKNGATLARILDTLDKHKAKAIFFVNGYRVKQNPELLKLIHERGQIIGNHSWDHINLKNEPADVVARQIGDVQDIVEELTGERPKFFRPPHGAGSDIVRAAVKEHGMLYMTWSNGSLDWADNRNNPDGVIETVLNQLLPGSNILMHELEWTADALDELLTKIGEQGYSFADPRLIELEAR